MDLPAEVECGFCDAVYLRVSDGHDTLACAAAHDFAYTPKFLTRLEAAGLDPSIGASVANLKAAWAERHAP